jgi:hypothetical protein
LRAADSKSSDMRSSQFTSDHMKRPWPAENV